MPASKIAKKLPKRVGRGKGGWIAIARGRDHKERAMVYRDARRGINFPSLTDAGSAAYRRSTRH